MRDYADKGYLRRPKNNDMRKTLLHAAWAGPAIYLLMVFVLS